MAEIASIVLPLAFVLFILTQVFLKPILAVVSTPKTDLTRIKANLAGLLGAAGPGREVVGVLRAGTIFPRRGVPTARRYLVSLKATDGEIERRFVDITVSLFGEGEMTVQHNHYRSGSELSRISDGAI